MKSMGSGRPFISIEHDRISHLLQRSKDMPQISRTYHSKLVGALSIPMVCNTESWSDRNGVEHYIETRYELDKLVMITFAVAGAMRDTLLIMCLFWRHRHRQHKLGIDDFGHSLHGGDERSFEESEALGGVGGPDADTDREATEGGEDTPLGEKWKWRGERKFCAFCAFCFWFCFVVLLSVKLV